MLPKVTIQIPTYKQKQFIKTALDSALFQNYENLQVIVADDCSPDYDIFEYLKEYDDNPRVLIHRNESNLGRVGNYRHTLYHLVEGEWYINLDGDDRFDDVQFLSKAMKQITQELENSRIVAFEFNHRLGYIKKHIRSFRNLDDETIAVSGRDYLMMQKYYHNFMHANTIFNVEAAKKTDFYNLDILSSDFFSAVKIWTQGDLLLSSKTMFNWNIHNENATFTTTLKHLEKEHQAIENFKVYGQEHLRAKQLRKVIYSLEYLLYNRVIDLYTGRKKDYHFYRYVISKFRMNKFFIRKLLSEFFK